MTDEELIEAVARALVPVTSGVQEDALGRELPDKQFDDLEADWQEAYRKYARAVIPVAQAPLLARIAELEKACGRLEEQAILHDTERKLILHDREINDIIQRRLACGEWLVGTEGRVRNTDTLRSTQ